MSASTDEYDQELDCPWHDPVWLQDHVEWFPLAATIAAELAIEREGML